MDRAEIENWLWKSRECVIDVLGFDTDWWPMTNSKGKTDRQGQASAWALAFFLTAANDRCTATTLRAAFHAADDFGNKYRKRLLDTLWSRSGREHSAHEVLVDFSIQNWDVPDPVQLTGESEVYPSHGVGDTLESPDDYSWDFYKLLVIPSRIRLFVARVAGHGGKSVDERVEALSTTLQGLVEWYSPLIRPGDELGAVIIPAGKRSSSETRILWLEGGALRCEKVANSPLT